MFSSLRRIQWCVAFCAINRLAPWHHAMDGPPSVDSTGSSRHRSIAGYRPTIVLIAAGRRSVHSMRLSHILGQIPNFCLPTCIRRFRWVEGFCQNIAVTFGTEKLEWCGYPKVKKTWRYVYSFWQNACTNVTDKRADRRMNTEWRLRPRLHSIVQQKNGNKTAKINVKNFHESLTTVVRAQNDTTKTANITYTILDRTLV